MYVLRTTFVVTSNRTCVYYCPTVLMTILLEPTTTFKRVFQLFQHTKKMTQIYNLGLIALYPTKLNNNIKIVRLQSVPYRDVALL